MDEMLTMPTYEGRKEERKKENVYSSPYLIFVRKIASSQKCLHSISNIKYQIPNTKYENKISYLIPKPPFLINTTQYLGFEFLRLALGLESGRDHHQLVS